MAAAVARSNNDNSLRKSQLFKRASLLSRKNEDQNDDEAERAALLAEDKNHAAQFSTPRGSTHSSVVGTPTAISSPQKEHFQGCLKLFAENKINKDNAWNLQLIDFMSAMLRKHDSRMENLQMASTTLDASTRIYSFRVDAVHHDVLTMAGGLSKAAQVRRGKKPDGDNPEGNEGENDGEPEGSTQKKKKKKGAKSSLSNNPEHQLNAEVELNECIDPFFAQLAATTGDMTSSNRAFNATLPVHDSSYGLILRSDIPFLDLMKGPGKDELNINTTDVFELKQSLFPLIKEDDQICTPFHGFSLTNWDPDDEEAKMKENNKWQETNLNLSQQAMAFDMNADVEPLPQDDNFMYDNDDHCNVESDEEEMGVMTHAIRPDKKNRVAHLVDMRPSARSDAFLEYSYSGAVVGSWAGPAHWKLKNNVNRLTRINEKSQTLTKVGVRKAPSRKKKDLDYISEEGLSFSRAYKKCPEYTPITQAKIAIGLKTLSLGATWNGKKLRIPIDKGYDLTHFRKFYLKQNVILKSLTQEQESDGKDITHRLSDIHDYDYNNDNDTSYCPNSQPNADGDEWVGDEEVVGDVHHQNKSFEINGDLVEPPAKVAKTFIPYAMRAKKVDMKQLKQVTWKMLTFSEEGADKENDPNGCDMERVQETKFTSLYKKIPLKLSSSMKDCLSVPLSLLAVLHLANERCLKLTSTNNYTDFIISKEL